MERGVYSTKNQSTRATFTYKQEGLLCLGVAKVESKEYGIITGKFCLVLNYTGKKNFTIDAYKNEAEMNSQEYGRLIRRRHHGLKI